MENHVSGLPASFDAAPTLGQLRQALLAVYAGSPHFTPAELLQANHAAHECDDAAQLTQWLAYQRGEAQRRARVAQLQQQASQQSPIASQATHEAEVAQLARCPHLDPQAGPCFVNCSRGASEPFRVRILGEAYLMLLERLGQLSPVRN